MLPSDKERDNQELVLATERLFQAVIPNVARKWLRHVSKSWRLFLDPEKQSVEAFLFEHADVVSSKKSSETRYASWVARECRSACSLLHRSGVNVRFLGRVFDAVRALPTKEAGKPPSEQDSRYLDTRMVGLASHILLAEMVARVGKLQLRRGLRERQQQSSTVVHQPMVGLAVQFLNFLFGADSRMVRWSQHGERARFWRLLARELGEKFFWGSRPPFVAGDDGIPPGDQIPIMGDSQLFRFVRCKLLQGPEFVRHRNALGIGGKDDTIECLAPLAVWLRLMDSGAIEFAPHVGKEMGVDPARIFDRDRPFSSGDIAGFDVRVKSLPIVENAVGFVSLGKAQKFLKQSNYDDAERGFRRALSALRTALEGDANSITLLTGLALAVEGMAACLQQRGQTKEDLASLRARRQRHRFDAAADALCRLSGKAVCCAICGRVCPVDNMNAQLPKEGAPPTIHIPHHVGDVIHLDCPVSIERGSVFPQLLDYAERLYKKALKLDPFDNTTLYLAGEFYERWRAHLAEARGFFLEIMEHQPADPASLKLVFAGLKRTTLAERQR
jgi:tetratricopeptide (TPR) repeat protein